MCSPWNFVLCSVAMLSLLPCMAQQPAASSKAVAEDAASILPATYLKVASTTPVPGISEPFLTTALCGPDKAILVRVAGLGGMGDLVSISDDGQTVIRFSAFKVSDITNPSFSYYFATGSDVYVLARSSKPTDETMKLRTPNGDIITQQKFATRDYIVQFQRDGTYIKSIPLDLPFSPLQVGAFPSGGFLVAGAARDGTRKPMIALLKPDGEFDRYLELKGDIHAAKTNNKEHSKDSTALPLFAKGGEGKKSLTAAESLSLVVPDGRNLLLVRSGQNVPVFSVSPGGEVRPVTPEVPPGFTLFDLRAGQNTWVALYTHPHSDDPKNAAVDLETYALDPASGKATARYVYPKFLGFGLACADSFEFTLLERPDDKLEIIKLVPIRTYSSEKTDK